MKLLWQWSVREPVASMVTVYMTAPALPDQVTRAEWLRQTSEALTFCGAHGTERKQRGVGGGELNQVASYEVEW